MDKDTLSATVKEAGFRLIDITDGITDPSLSDDERYSYLQRRQAWVTKGNKAVALVVKNPVTARIVFGAKPAEKDVHLTPARLCLLSKHGSFFVVPDAKKPPILTFLRGQAIRCGACGKHRSETSAVGSCSCNECGFNQCISCVRKGPKSLGLFCYKCNHQMGDVDNTGAFVAALQHHGASRPQNHITMVQKDNAAEIYLGKAPGAREEETKLLLDPNMQLTARPEFQRSIGTGIDLAQVMIDAYVRRLRQRENKAAPFANVLICLTHDKTPAIQGADSISAAEKEIKALVARKMRWTLSYRQDDVARKAADQLLKRAARNGNESFAMLVMTSFPSEKTVRIDMHIIHEVAKDFLVLTQGWICARCQKPAAKLRCSRCHVMRYCGEACHKAHWEDHKLLCERLAQDIALHQAMTVVAERSEDTQEKDSV